MTSGVYLDVAKHGRALRNTDIPTILDLYRQGMSCNEIGQRYGTLRGAIYSIVAGKTWKVVTGGADNRRTRPNYDARRRRMLRMYDKGLTLKQIAAIYGISTQCVSTMLRKVSENDE